MMVGGAAGSIVLRRRFHPGGVASFKSRHRRIFASVETVRTRTFGGPFVSTLD